MMHLVFWGGVAWLAYVFVGYPLLLAILGMSRRTRDSRGAVEPLPCVSVLIAARNEEKDIDWKIRETLDWDYPPDRLQILVASDASEDHTDEIVQSIRDPRLIFVRMPQRSGKIIALNHLVALAQGDVLFFTDANTSIGPRCAQKMVRHFADPRVGCVTGWEGGSPSENQSLTVAGLASLGYEASLNALESRLGSVLICDGSIFCIRASLYRPLHPDLANDLELPLWIGSQGHKLLYEPEARSTENATSSPGEEFQRRRRICAQGLSGLWTLKNMLGGMRAWQFFSRKFLRWLTLVPLVMILVSTFLLRSSPYFRFLLVTQMVFYAVAAIGWLFAARGRKGSRVFSMPFYFLLLSSAAFVGVIEACFGRRFSVWDIASLSRGHEQGA
jgi:cellulose synthase/poly-beta-1,6-N-acetylglucosamine synthase-like glycosyltransferase